MNKINFLEYSTDSDIIFVLWIPWDIVSLLDDNYTCIYSIDL